MSITDYLINGLLIALVLRQVRGRKLTVKMLLVPLAIVAAFGVNYIHGIPTGGNNLTLVLLGIASGAVLGVGAGLLTRVFRGPDGSIWSKAGIGAAVLWVLGVGSRVAFELYVTHGGQGAVSRFSAAHGITGSSAWVDALVLMGLTEVVSRTAVIALRFHKRHSQDATTAAPGAIMEISGHSI